MQPPPLRLLLQLPMACLLRHLAANPACPARLTRACLLLTAVCLRRLTQACLLLTAVCLPRRTLAYLRRTLACLLLMLAYPPRLMAACRLRLTRARPWMAARCLVTRACCPRPCDEKLIQPEEPALTGGLFCYKMGLCLRHPISAASSSSSW